MVAVKSCPHFYPYQSNAALRLEGVLAGTVVSPIAIET